MVSSVRRIPEHRILGLRRRRDLPQHVWDNEKPNVAASNVDLLQMADSPVARRHGDVFELDIHVVFGYSISQHMQKGRDQTVSRTLNELAAVGLARGDLQGHNMAL